MYNSLSLRSHFWFRIDKLLCIIECIIKHKTGICYCILLTFA